MSYSTAMSSNLACTVAVGERLPSSRISAARLRKKSTWLLTGSLTSHWSAKLPCPRIRIAYQSAATGRNASAEGKRNLGTRSEALSAQEEAQRGASCFGQLMVGPATSAGVATRKDEPPFWVTEN